MQQRSFEEILKGQTAGFSLTPKEGLWQNIEQGLAPEKRKRSFVWIWFCAGLSFLVSAVYTILPSPQMPLKHVAGASAQKTFTQQPVTKGATEFLANAHESVLNPKKYLSTKSKHKDELFYSQIGGGKSPLPGSIFIQNVAADIAEEIVPLVDKFEPENNDIVSQNENDVVPTENQADFDSVMGIQHQDTAKKVDPDIAIAKPHRPYLISVGLMLTPLRSEALLTVDRPGTTSITDYYNRKATDKSNEGYGIRLSGAYERGRHSFYTGLEYQYLSYQILLKQVERKPIRTSTIAQKTVFTSQDSFQFMEKEKGGTYYSTHFTCLSIPVGYSFKFVDIGLLKIGLNGNLAYNFILNSNALIYDEVGGYYVRQEAVKNNTLRKNNLMLASGIDINYQISHLCTLTIQPHVGMSLRPFEKAAISTGIRYAGLGIGLKWYLR